MALLSTQQRSPVATFDMLARFRSVERVPQPATFCNPVLDLDFPDPNILKVGNVYYAYATNGNGCNIQVARSTDMIHWDSLTDALPVLPRWAVQKFGFTWAPEVSSYCDPRTGRPTYVMYFVVRFPTARGGKQCIGTATSLHPMGPFIPRHDRPFICPLGQGGAIDPDSYIDDDGTRYVLWKNDGNAEGKRTWLFVQKVSEDGQTLTGDPIKMITVDQAWEGNLVEAPVMWKHDGRYFLFYSANNYGGKKYAVGYAVADKISGPYHKPHTTPFMATNSTAGFSGPGGQDITVDAAGNTWLYFHSWTANRVRCLNMIQLEWRDGLPYVQPLSRNPQNAPHMALRMDAINRVATEFATPV